MTDDTIELTRRKILGGVGAMGMAGAAAGLGSSAFFSDQETFVNNRLVAGELDMKVAATHHYVDWLPDTAGDDAPAPPQETDDAAMPNGGDADLRLVADQDGGADTVESDIELAIDGDLGAGSVVNTVNGGASSSISCGGTKDADGPVLIDLDDVKPGDFGFARFCFRLCDNPGYVWLDSSLNSASEGPVPEPEQADPDEDYPNGDTVELLDEVQVALLGYDVARTGGNSGGTSDAVLDENDPAVEIGPGMTLREFLGSPVLLGQDSEDPGTIPAEEGGGASGRCYEANPAGETNCVTLVWWLPVDHGNELQGDQASFDLGFYTEQCRHNDGAPIGNNGDPPAGGIGEEDPQNGGGEGDESNGGTDGDQKAISFIAFCAAGGLSESDISIDNVGTKNGSEPIEVDWSSTKDVDTVVVKAGPEIQNFAGGTSGTVISGTGNDAGNDQSPSDPCPDGESGPKYNWEGGNFKLDQPT